MSYLGWVVAALSIIIGLYVHIVSQPQAKQATLDLAVARETEVTSLRAELYPTPTPRPTPCYVGTRTC